MIEKTAQVLDKGGTFGVLFVIGQWAVVSPF